MADRIIKGYWDCPHCGNKGIDGLVDICPSCGSAKDKNVRYYMKSVEEVSDEELTKAGLSREEADGEHREWICAYCGSLNNYSDQICAHCGADKKEKEQDYGGDTHKTIYIKDSRGQFKKTAPDEEIPKETYQTRQSVETPPKRGNSKAFLGILIALAAVLAVLFWPHTTSEAITGFSWNRSVTVEEMQTFSESGWTLPDGARLTDSKREMSGYRQVIDHYETVYVTKTRDVIDHYDTSYEYTDNGNGTFSEHEVQTPVYRTETYEEPEEQPVYRDEPVYQTKYYYDIDRWTEVKTYETSGEDHEAYWSDEYTLESDQRDTQRSEQYFTIYNETDEQRTTYDRWEKQNIGDGIYITRNILGMEYSRKEVN